MDSIPVTIYCSGLQGEDKTLMLVRLVHALTQCGIRVGVQQHRTARAAGSDNAFISAGAVTYLDLCAGTIATASGNDGSEHIEKKIFSDCAVVLVDDAFCSSKTAAALNISDGLFTGFGQACPDAFVMAGLIRRSILHPCIAGAVLAGGSSSRLGRNKALLPLQGKTVIETVVNELRSCVDPVIIITNSPEEYARFDYPCRGDVLPGGGPLSGIHAALTHCDTEYVLVASCDIPLVTSELFEELITSLPGHDIVIFKHRHFEPLCALYRRTCLPALEDLIAHGEYRIIDLFPSLLVKVLRIDSSDVFKNINTDADYESVCKGPAFPVQNPDRRRLPGNNDSCGGIGGKVKP